MLGANRPLAFFNDSAVVPGAEGYWGRFFTHVSWELQSAVEAKSAEDEMPCRTSSICGTALRPSRRADAAMSQLGIDLLKASRSRPGFLPPAVSAIAETGFEHWLESYFLGSHRSV